jgi:transcriptional regulator with XRE-family HTH domain
MTAAPSSERPDVGGRIRHANRGRATRDTSSDGHRNGHDSTRHDASDDTMLAQIRRLLTAGGTYRSIAAAAGLAPATVHDIAAGRQTPTPHTSRALAKVTSGSLRRARVDAGGTRLRLRALHVMGHSSARIARALGVREMTIRAITRGDATTVSTTLRDDIADLYDTWWDKTAPERTRAERAAATAARRRAIAGNWCAGAGLDDDQLDTPGYRPKSKWKPAAGTGTAPGIRPPALPRKTRRQEHRQPRHPNPAAGEQPCP